MSDDDWGLENIPRWMWPYVRTASEVSLAASLLGSAIAIQQIGSKLGGEQGKALTEAAGSVVADWEDEFCGTPPRPHRVFGLAGQMAEFAASLPAGSALGASLRQAAGSLVSKSLEQR
jgi:hypothetical protein